MRETFIRRDRLTDNQYGSLFVSYGTGEFLPDQADIDLVIGTVAEARLLGLHKPTCFSLALDNRKHLLWCREFFVAPEYRRSLGITIGHLTAEQAGRARRCLDERRRRALP